MVGWFADTVNAVLEADPEDPVTAMHKGTLITRFYPIVECAYLIASADGGADFSEQAGVAEKLVEVTGGALTAEDVMALITDSTSAAEEEGRDARIESLPERLETEAEREAAFMVAAAAAWTGGGVGAQEGLAMQAMARAFGWEIGHMHQLLGAARG